MSRVAWRLTKASPTVGGHTEQKVKWTPSVGPKAGWRKRDACSDFVIIKKHIVVFVVNWKDVSVVSSEHELTGRVSRGVWGIGVSR